MTEHKPHRYHRHATLLSNNWTHIYGIIAMGLCISGFVVYMYFASAAFADAISNPTTSVGYDTQQNQEYV
jgi:hypothetical protein